MRQGIDPSEQRKAKKESKTGDTANSFEVVAREWFLKYQPVWSESHSERTIRRLERDIFPWLGALPIDEIKAPALLGVLRRIEERGAVETAHRALQNAGQIFRYAIATGRAERDISADLRGALSPVQGGSFSAVVEPQQVADLLRTLDSYEGTFPVQCALKIAPHLFVRPGELRSMEWAHVDLDAAQWRYLVTKTKTDHVVPLSKQVVSILRELHALTGTGRFTFPSARVRDGSRCMSEVALLAALRRMDVGKDISSIHGLRATARTMLDEVLGFRPDIIEAQLAHSVRDANGRAYNRTSFITERTAMMQRWSDYLDELKAGATILQFKRTG